MRGLQLAEQFRTACRRFAMSRSSLGGVTPPSGSRGLVSAIDLRAKDIAKMPHVLSTRMRLKDRYCTDPYEPEDPKERPIYPKRKKPEKRAQALIDALHDEEAALMVLSGRSVFPRKIPSLQPGFIVRVTYKIDASRPNLQYFTGVCIAIKNRGLGSSFVLRNVVDNVPVERSWPLYSPLIRDAEVVGKREYRRNKLWYLRRKPLRESRFGVATKRPSPAQ